MCGRFENTVSLENLFSALELENISLKNELTQTNIAPTQKIMTVTSRGDKLKLLPMNWGIKFSKDTPLIFNSRIETIKEKPYWRKLFDSNRCIVPMSAFYEWKKEGNRKIPYRIFLKKEKLFFVPAVYLQKDNEFYASLITTTPNKFIEKIHHRMPVILRKEDAVDYLQCDSQVNLNRCIPYEQPEDMAMERVTL